MNLWKQKTGWTSWFFCYLLFTFFLLLSSLQFFCVSYPSIKRHWHGLFHSIQTWTLKICILSYCCIHPPGGEPFKNPPYLPFVFSEVLSWQSCAFSKYAPFGLVTRVSRYALPRLEQLGLRMLRIITVWSPWLMLCPAALRRHETLGELWENYKAENPKNPAGHGEDLFLFYVVCDLWRCLSYWTIFGSPLCKDSFSLKENDNQILFAKDPWNRLHQTIPNTFDILLLNNISTTNTSEHNIYSTPNTTLYSKPSTLGANNPPRTSWQRRTTTTIPPNPTQTCSHTSLH